MPPHFSTPLKICNVSPLCRDAVRLPPTPSPSHPEPRPASRQAAPPHSATPEPPRRCRRETNDDREDDAGLAARETDGAEMIGGEESGRQEGAGPAPADPLTMRCEAGELERSSETKIKEIKNLGQYKGVPNW